MGQGIIGEIAARMGTLERRQREEETAAWDKEREQMEALEAPVKELCELTITGRRGKQKAKEEATTLRKRRNKRKKKGSAETMSDYEENKKEVKERA